MSSYINCCTTDYSRNSTNIREFLYYYTPDGENYPYRSCAVDLAGNAIPLPRSDTYALCYDDPYHVPPCGTNGMGKGAWPAPFPEQTFEKLSVLKNVAFSYLGNEIAAYKVGHGLTVGGETFTISNQTGVNAVLNGTWTVSAITSTSQFNFFISTTPSAPLSQADLDFRHQMDFCKGKGFKVVHAKKLWNGRYGFVSDYVSSPKSATSKFKKYNVSITENEEASGSYKVESGAGINIDNWSFGGNINGNSNQSLTIGGVTDCFGFTQGNPGNFTYRVVTDGTQTYYTDCQDDESPPISTNIYATVCGFPEIAPTYNTQQVKDFCGINGDRGIVTCVVPVGGTTIDNLEGWSEYKYMILTAAKTSYVGTPENFQTYLSTFDQNIPFSNFHPYIGIPGFEDVVINGSVVITHTGTITLTETGIHVVVKIASAAYTVYSHPSAGTIRTGDAYFKASFNGTATLSSEYTIGACQAEAQSLLSHWDMTNDAVYPWRTDGNCGVAPMVIIKETNGGIGFGYCDTHADISLLAAYDGSIYGKPLPVGYYNKGWFDFIEDEYHYTDTGEGCTFGGTLCKSYGNYAPDYLPTATTHWTDGALDTSCKGAGWSPFSRFKENYQYELPPFVNHGCAFSANNQEAFWVSKWAELKEPLPSQNYWGPCGVQPNQCALDSHGGAFATCEPMRDLHVLEAETCEITADLRYPSAFAICGKSTIISISVNMFGYTRIIHSSTPYLRVGDKIDLLDAAGNRPYFNITVTDVVSDTEFYCGTGGVLPTGVVAVASWNSPDPNWYDLSPKGYFVRTNDKNGVITSQEGNVKSTGSSRGIIAIVPAGSPELSSAAWPARSTVFYTDYPYIEPTGHWYSAINQAMSDRFWITNQDGQVSDGDEVDPHCAIKQKNGMPCIIAPCDPILTPLVEARLHAPTGAPLQFLTDSLHQWGKMIPPDEWGTTCSNVWNYGESPLAFAKQYGVANNYGDSLNTTGISTDTNIGWGTADQYFIP